MFQYLLKTEILKYKELLRQLIVESCYIDEGKRHCGWHQYLGSTKIGVIATSQMILGLIKLGFLSEEKEIIEKAIKTLLDMQVISKSPEESGGWKYVTNANGISTTEPTAWALIAISKYIEEANVSTKLERRLNKTINNGAEWLKKNSIHINENYGWGPTNRSKATTYSTVLALRALSFIEGDNSIEFKRSLNWLTTNMNKDGGWGFTAGASSTHFQTIFVVELLNDLKKQIGTQTISYVKRSYKKLNLELETQQIDVINPKNGEAMSRLHYKHYIIPKLIKTNIGLFKWSQRNLKDIKELIKENPNGYLKREFEIDKKRTAWSCYEIADLISIIENSENNEKNCFYVKRGTLLQKKVNETIYKGFEKFILNNKEGITIAILFSMGLVLKKIPNNNILSVILFLLSPAWTKTWEYLEEELWRKS